MGYSKVTFGGKTLQVLSCVPIRTQKKTKIVMGKQLTQVKIIGKDAWQWEISINGIVTGTTQTDLDNNRADIEALNDLSGHAFVDGLHNGTYILDPTSLSFNDSGDDVNSSYKYNFKIVEE